MGWSIGYDDNWQRDIGYGVPAYCDHPKCSAEIDRGLSYVCGGEPYGGEKGCGLYFCDEHLSGGWGDVVSRCSRCRNHKPPFQPKPDHPRWIRHKLTHESWAEWRAQNPDEVAAMSTAQIGEVGRLDSASRARVAEPTTDAVRTDTHPGEVDD